VSLCLCVFVSLSYELVEGNLDGYSLFSGSALRPSATCRIRCHNWGIINDGEAPGGRPPLLLRTVYRHAVYRYAVYRRPLACAALHCNTEYVIEESNEYVGDNGNNGTSEKDPIQLAVSEM